MRIPEKGKITQSITGVQREARPDKGGTLARVAERLLKREYCYHLTVAETNAMISRERYPQENGMKYKERARADQWIESKRGSQRESGDEQKAHRLEAIKD